MDNITHALLGAGLVILVNPPRKYRRGIWLAVLLGSEAPDLDLLPSLVSSQAQVVLHRGYSHSLVGLCIIAGLITLIVGRLEPRLPRQYTLGWVAGAVLIHMGFDALTSYGTKVLYPFREQPVALDVLYGLDLFILVCLGLGTFFYFYKGKRQAVILAMLLVAAYIGGRWLVHANLLAQVAKQFPSAQFSVMPSLNPLGPWSVVVDQGDAYIVGQTKPWSQQIQLKGKLPKNLSNPMVEGIMANPTVDSYMEVARYPVAKVVTLADGWQVKLCDLRLWPQLTFNAVVRLDKQGKIRNIKVGPRN